MVVVVLLLMLLGSDEIAEASRYECVCYNFHTDYLQLEKYLAINEK